jgi:hypothetical protein
VNKPFLSPWLLEMDATVQRFVFVAERDVPPADL